MSIASRISAIEGHLENDWIGVENLLGEEKYDKNIENISAALEEVYDSLPQTTGTGTLMSLTTRKGGMKIQYNGDTSQGGTPTPSSPQPINVVSGRQEVEVCGNNFYNYDNNTDYSLYYLNSDGSWTNGGSNNINQRIGITSKTISVYIGSKSGGAYIRLGQFKSDGTFISRTLINQSTNNITLNNDCGYIWLSTNKDSTNYFTNVSVIYGTSVSSYEPYTGQSYEINLGKNLVDFDNPSGVYNCTYDTTTKIYTTSALTGNFLGINIWTANTPLVIPTGTSTFYYSADIKLASGTYNDKINLFREGQAYTGLTKVQTDISNPIISNEYQRYIFKFDYTNTSGNFISSSNNFIQLTRGASNAVLEIKNVMISKSDTTYVQYKTPIEVCKIGDYKDRIYKENGTWYIEKNIGKVVLNGSENWDNFSIESSGLGRAIVSGSNVLYGDNKNTIMASNMVGVQYSGSWSNTYDCIASYSNNRFIAYLKNASDLATFKSILNNSNAIVYYVLATPTYTQITDNELISQLNKIKKSYDNITNISVNSGDLPSPLNVIALEYISS